MKKESYEILQFLSCHYTEKEIAEFFQSLFESGALRVAEKKRYELVVSLDSLKQGNDDHELLDVLKQLRRKLALEENIPSFRVFTDRTLRDMVGRLPRSLEDLKEVHGVGEIKLAGYGQLFLDAINGYLDSQI